MPKIDLCFQGWVHGATVKTATDVNSKAVSVADMSADELAAKLKAGELFISLGDYLYDNNRDAEIELFDFEPSD